jgi:uncharacterized protein (TIGR00297 family)
MPRRRGLWPRIGGAAREDARMELAVRIVAGGALSAGVAAAAFRREALTRSGAWAAAVTGVVLVFAGWRWLALVGVFFVTSSVLTRLEAAGAGRRSHDRGGRRWRQVVANGGCAAAAAAVYAVTGWPHAFGVAGGAVAAATADTWATEAGRWSRTPPRLITTGAPVTPGASGGITLTGTMASLAGAMLIGAIAVALGGSTRTAAGAGVRSTFLWGASIALAGFTGSIFDSLLGATVEGRWRWLDNDAVNVAATAWGAAAMLVIPIA